MSELEARFRVSLEGKNELTDFFSKGEKGARSFGATMKSALGEAAKQFAAMGASAGKTLASMATGNLGFAAQAKSIYQLRDSISALTVASGKGMESLEPLRQEIHNIAKASNQMAEDVTAGMSAFVAKTGDLDTARKNMMLYGKVATATGASLMDVANVGVELKQKLGLEDQAEAMAVLVQQAKMGAIEFKDMASVGPKILAAAASAGASGLPGIRSAGAAVQVIASGFGGRGQGASASVSYENMIATLQKTKTRQRIEDLGIKVAGRDANEVFMEVIRRTGGDMTQLREIFRTQQAFRGITSFARDYDKTTGRFANFEKFKAASNDAGVISGDFNSRMQSGQQKLQASQIAIAATIDDKLGPALEKFAGQASRIAGVIGFAADHIGLTIAAIGGGIIAKNAAGGILSRVVGGAGGRLLGAAAGTGTPVFVTNWPGGGLPGGAPGPGGGGLLGRAARIASGAALPLAAIVGGAAIIDHLSDRGELIDKLNRAGETVDPEAARRFGTGYAREHKAVVRRGQMVTANPRQSLGDLDDTVKAENAQIDKLNLTVNIDGDRATAETDSGTRAPEVMVKRRSEFASGGRRGR